MNQIIPISEAFKSAANRSLALIAQMPTHFQRVQLLVALPIFIAVGISHHSATLSIDIHQQVPEHSTIGYVEPLTEFNQVEEYKETPLAKKKYTAKLVRTAGLPFAGFGSLEAAFAAVRKCESTHNYQAINPAGYYGAYQFHPGTWNSTAKAAGRADLVGVRPDYAAPSDQDAMALALYNRSGWGPWGCARKVGLI